MQRLFRATYIIVCFLALGFYLSIDARRNQQNPAQSKPDLSGTWQLDLKKSNWSKKSKPHAPIKISHHDPEFRVTIPSASNGQLVERDFTYFTDGRGETNPASSVITTNPSAVKTADIYKQVAASTTKWDGRKIVTRATLSLITGGRMIEYRLVDEWKLSGDGKVLTKTTRFVFERNNGAFIPALASDMKSVYNRL